MRSEKQINVCDIFEALEFSNSYSVIRLLTFYGQVVFLQLV